VRGGPRSTRSPRTVPAKAKVFRPPWTTPHRRSHPGRRRLPGGQRTRAARTQAAPPASRPAADETAPPPDSRPPTGPTQGSGHWTNKPPPPCSARPLHRELRVRRGNHVRSGPGDTPAPEGHGGCTGAVRAPCVPGRTGEPSGRRIRLFPGQ
jgi:hypothetical protein